MSTYVLMRILESAPGRYDRGIRVLTLGRASRAADRMMAWIRAGDRVLDLGCGTGAVALRAAHLGARVLGIDGNPRMLECARIKAIQEGLAGAIRFSEMGVGEMDAFAEATFDVVTASLCFSELSEDETGFALRHAARVLRPGGVLLVADEARPVGWFASTVYWLLRAPLVALVWIATQQTTHPTVGLAAAIRRAEFSLVRVTRRWGFLEITARAAGGDGGEPAPQGA